MIRGCREIFGKRLWVLGFFCLAFALALPTAAHAQAARGEEPKIGYVDMGRLFDDYQKTKDYDSRLTQKGQRKQDELEGRISEIQKMQESLELMNPDARSAKMRELEAKADELKRYRNYTAQDLQEERNKMASEILAEIGTSVKAFGKANGFMMILDGRSILYGESAIDVTDPILNHLNSTYKQQQ